MDSKRLQFALQAIYNAGRLTLPFFSKRITVERKSDNSPVTEADKLAEKYLREQIRKYYPEDAILGEEEGDSEGVSGGRWVIDPIDGTRSFIAGVPFYANLLSYEKEGSVQIGVSYFPALDEIVYAERGSGTYLNGRRCYVSSRGNLKGAIICHSSIKTFHKINLLGGLLSLADQVDTLRTWSDAYGHALVAKGVADAMLDPVVAHWDISPMSLIVQEAGGLFTTLEGKEELSSSAVASNGLIHKEILEALSK